MTAARPHDDIEGALGAHRALLVTLESLTDDDIARPSLLPRWSVGHVLAHLARNADSHVRAFTSAAAGRAGVRRYPGGPEQRDREIDESAGRPAAVAVADVRRTAMLLEACWEACDASGWAIVGLDAGGSSEPLTGLPWKRWRETEVHHRDLGLAFTEADWSPGYVRRELRLAEMAWRASRPMGLTPLPAAALALEPHRRLAWLLGRADIAGLPDAPHWI